MKVIGIRLAIGLSAILLMGPWLAAQEVSFPVRHQHVWKSCQGDLIFGAGGVEYRTGEKKHARSWKYEDIQQLGLLGSKEVSILTYEDDKWQLGRDRLFRFELTSGEITPALWSMLQERLTRPLVSAVAPTDIVARYSLPVKHTRGFGGSEGTLELADQYIIYRTEEAKGTRIWRYGDISSIGSTGPYQLRITTMERVNGESGGERNFVFSLKRLLEPAAYDFAWWKINGPHIEPAGKR